MNPNCHRDLLSYPEEDGHDLARDLAPLPADGGGEVPGEEGQPAHQEGSHHHPQRHERLVLLPPRRVHTLPFPQSWGLEDFYQNLLIWEIANEMEREKWKFHH